MSKKKIIKEVPLTQLDTTLAGYYGQRLVGVEDAYGLEIELEGLPADGINFGRNKGWTTVADGSLRNGTEFISNGPQPYTELRNNLEVLNARFNKLNFTPNFSYRTSLHVHMDMSGETWRDVVNLFTLYTIFEHPLMDMCGEERWGNVHCLPIIESQDQIHLVASMCSPGGYFNGGVDNLTARDRRYAAFNFASLPQHRTLEFRAHRGTCDTDEVMRWVDALAALKRAAKQYQNPQQIVQDFSNMGMRGFADSVFGQESPVPELCANYTSEIWSSLRLAQEIAYCRQEWGDRPATVEKKDAPERSIYDVEVWEQQALAEMHRAQARRGGQRPNGWANFRNQPPAHVVQPNGQRVANPERVAWNADMRWQLQNNVGRI